LFRNQYIYLPSMVMRALWSQTWFLTLVLWKTKTAHAAGLTKII
jgi:hypothetical protein